MPPKPGHYSRQYMLALATKGGASTTARKARAARANGKKGGRPRKNPLPPPAPVA